MRTLAWIAGCLLIACSGNSIKTSDAGNVSNTDGGPDGGNSSDGGTDGGDPSLIYHQSFAGPNGSDWPSPWRTIGTHTDVHDIQNNWGRFRSDAIPPYPLGRMLLPGFHESDVDVTWTVSLEDPVNQGSGFYVRQNEQYIGNGYCLFLEGNLLEPDSHHLAFWYSLNGTEYRVYQPATPIPSTLQANVPYRLRFEVVQVDSANTRLRAKLWLASETQPDAWQMEYVDSTPELQVSGSFAFDVYDKQGTGHAFVRDLEIRRPQP